MNLDPSNGGRDHRESDVGKRLPEGKETAATNEEEDGSWPHFQEEDYIVFCFTEDGEIHVVEDTRSESSSSTLPRTNKKLRPLGRRLLYEENGERSYVEEERGDIVIPREKGAFCMEEGEESGRGDGEGAKETIRTRGDEGVRLESCESRSGQYDHSSASRSSFAFPVLGWEWVGSPVHMPKPEDGPYSKKHRARRLFIHCCGF